MRSHGILGLALTAALAAAALTHAYLGRLEKEVPVVVAARDLTAPVLVTPGDVRLEPMPLGVVHRSAFTDPAAVTGRYLLFPAVAGQVLLEPQLAAPGAAGPVADRLAGGSVAFFVPLSLARGLGGAVSEGDHIDLIGIFASSPSASPSVHSLVHGVRVLEVRDETGHRYEPGARSATPAGVLVEVEPGEAARLAFAIENGSVFAVLRPAGGGPGVAGAGGGGAP